MQVPPNSSGSLCMVPCIDILRLISNVWLILTPSEHRLNINLEKIHRKSNPCFFFCRYCSLFMTARSSTGQHAGCLVSWSLGETSPSCAALQASPYCPWWVPYTIWVCGTRVGRHGCMLKTGGHWPERRRPVTAIKRQISTWKMGDE